MYFFFRGKAYALRARRERLVFSRKGKIYGVARGAGKSYFPRHARISFLRRKSPRGRGFRRCGGNVLFAVRAAARLFRVRAFAARAGVFLGPGSGARALDFRAGAVAFRIGARAARLRVFGRFRLGRRARVHVRFFGRRRRAVGKARRRRRCFRGVRGSARREKRGGNGGFFRGGKRGGSAVRRRSRGGGFFACGAVGIGGNGFGAGFGRVGRGRRRGGVRGNGGRERCTFRRAAAAGRGVRGNFSGSGFVAGLGEAFAPPRHHALGREAEGNHGQDADSRGNARESARGFSRRRAGSARPHGAEIQAARGGHGFRRSFSRRESVLIFFAETRRRNFRFLRFALCFRAGMRLNSSVI